MQFGKGVCSTVLLDAQGRTIYSPKHLVFGKAVRVRHYPVTVSTENLSRDSPATGSSASGKALKFD
jgi:hypothetical protein